MERKRKCSARKREGRMQKVGFVGIIWTTYLKDNARFPYTDRLNSTLKYNSRLRNIP